MSEHTPTVERARDMYSWAYAWRTDDDIEGGDSDLSQMRATLRAEFDRMLAAHDQEVRLAALEEAEKAIQDARYAAWEAAVEASRYSYENLDWWVNPYLRSSSPYRADQIGEQP